MTHAPAGGLGAGRHSSPSAFAIVGVAMEIVTEPSARHGADPGLIPGLPHEICGTGNPKAPCNVAPIGFMGTRC